MDKERAALTAGLKQRLIWIAASGLIAALLAVVVLAATGPMTFNLALAVVLGTFFTVMLGGGLFAVSFYSDSSGYDDEAANTGEMESPKSDRLDRH